MGGKAAPQFPVQIPALPITSHQEAIGKVLMEPWFWGNASKGAYTYSATRNYASQAQSDQAALNDCAAAGYTNRIIALRYWNGYLAIAYDEFGHMYAASDEKESKAKKSAMASCKKAKSKQCKVFKIVESRPIWVQ